MHWSSVNEFLAMGGYARYVWGSFFACFFLLLMEVVVLRKKNKKVIKNVYEREDENE